MIIILRIIIIIKLVLCTQWELKYPVNKRKWRQSEIDLNNKEIYNIYIHTDRNSLGNFWSINLLRGNWKLVKF